MSAFRSNHQPPHSSPFVRIYATVPAVVKVRKPITAAMMQIIKIAGFSAKQRKTIIKNRDYFQISKLTLGER